MAPRAPPGTKDWLGLLRAWETFWTPIRESVRDMRVASRLDLFQFSRLGLPCW